MSKRFAEYKGLDLTQTSKEILDRWKREDAFRNSLKERDGHPSFVFFDGPPSANGKPGIHHVMARTIKDSFCRYKTQQGFKVVRKAGWDTHGLPVELGVEKMLGITKEDIGGKISVDEYNAACRKEVMKYIDLWADLTEKMGYWVDMDDPYITYDNRYIETLWWLLKRLYEKGFLYKGYTIQPYSPAAGTGLSSHELNQPGCYRDVKDTTLTAQFSVIQDAKSQPLFDLAQGLPLYFLAWTTTPWTLPSNTALCVGEKIVYQVIKTHNPYSGTPEVVVLARDLVPAYFNKEGENKDFDDYKAGDKVIPYAVLAEFNGKDLVGMRYEQLLPFAKPDLRIDGQPTGKAFEVISGDYVTTSDGTGIVHIAPDFGADDARVARNFGIVPLMFVDRNGKQQPMVDRRGRFFVIEDLDPNYVKEFLNAEAYGEFAGRFVKNAYDETLAPDAPTLDLDICMKLKAENKAFKIAKHVHSYPHCWRTDKPVLYYPLDSWFIKTTAVKDRLIELNNTINWKPAHTGSGRFGNWLENLQDWNLSRSRFWGTPLPIWRTEDGREEKCIGSMVELMTEIEKAVAAGVMTENPYKDFKVGDNSAANYDPTHIDLHRPYIDGVVLVSESGKPMHREPDLVDVWFDSGAMPFAQYHYPFEQGPNAAQSDKPQNEGLLFPADFIAEGVDQTRGWFFTLHAIATMCFDSVAYKNVISNGLVLDKNGNKMSKRLGNAVDPFETIEKYGPDALRWYMLTNAQPWDNLKFDVAGVDEVRRKFFGTLYNTYSFFALYANIDGFTGQEPQVPVSERPEIDRWIISLLNSLVTEVTDAMESYEPTRAGRAIQDFVMDNLSNWYVRLNRKRFWGGTMNQDKLAAYQTLFECLTKVVVMAAPIAPFITDRIYRDLVGDANATVHLAQWPTADQTLVCKALEERMAYAQNFSSMILALRRKVNIKVRQPLSKILIPASDEEFKAQVDLVQNLILTEVNVKELQFVTEDNGVLKKRIKPNFKALGPKHGKLMKGIAAEMAKMTSKDIAAFERTGSFSLSVQGEQVNLEPADAEIVSEDIPGWLVANEGKLTVALDIEVSPELRKEGIAREFINRIQNLRKDSGFDVTDKIRVRIQANPATDEAVTDYAQYIASQTLAVEVKTDTTLTPDVANSVELDDNLTLLVAVEKV
ncbi:MAG: isoleucine--tRNA ligase [Bacteroidales bacterium]|nr:isoleucine--tRNA ligase [Bacteroidales bacterium]